MDARYPKWMRDPNFWPEWQCAECGKTLRRGDTPPPIFTADEEAWCSKCVRPETLRSMAADNAR